MTSLGNAIASSVGKKIVMGLTGLLLVVFLVEHLHGNLKLVEDPSGKAFDDYVDYLQGFGILLTVAELGLALLFLVHVYMAFRLTQENWQARKTRYVIRSNRGASSLASVSMFYTGALLLGYLLKHLLDFRLSGAFFDDPSGVVKSTMSHQGHALVYVLAAVVLGIHLSHGVRSAFQSLGVNHPRWNPLLARLGILIAVVFALGYLSIPVYLFLAHGAGK